MITNKKFKDTRTGEIVEQFDIMDIKYMEEVEDEEDEEIAVDDLIEGLSMEEVEDEDIENEKINEESKAYKYIYNFVNDYCDCIDDRKEFFENLGIYLDEEIEKEKECNQ